MSTVLHLRMIGGCIAAVMACGLSSCSMHPLPEDVSRASTVDIVARIRCEVWEGLNAFRPDDEDANWIIAATTIGYDFDFIIDEANKAGAGRLEFRRPAFLGEKTGFFLDLDAKASLERKNTRSFRIIDELSKLRLELKEKTCSQVTQRANGVYPMTGATGMSEVVRTYIKLEKLTDLVRDDDGRVFADELRFTTKVSVGATPTLELRTVAGDLRLSKASIAGTASRDDVHTVTVALSRAEGFADRPITLTMGVRDSRALRKLIQNKAGAQNRVLFELQRRRNAREDAKVVARILNRPLP